MGLGTPLQHEWMVQFDDYKYPKIAVGAAFDFVTGKQKQCPDSVGNIGFEWMFRLANSPKRLWFRYLVMGPAFILLVVWQKLLNIFDF